MEREFRARESGQLITLFLCGDVMTGRGIDQILPHPSDPALREPWIRDARDYVELAERVNGPVPRPVGLGYIWGDALEELQRVAPDVRIINLETSVTRSDEYWPDKDIHYRMNPDNVACLLAARVDVCVLANNHVLDFGPAGLLETLGTLHRAGLQTAGAGGRLPEAQVPAVISVPQDPSVLVFAWGTESSGVGASWAATSDRPGVDVLPSLSIDVACQVSDRIRRTRRAGDVVVASIHWGSNWGFGVPQAHARFAHRLIDEGVDIVHGHSSHHVRPIEVYRDRLILYGCGDLLNDYEGIADHDAYRNDLSLLYFPSLLPTGELRSLRMVPMQIRKFQLKRASVADARWLEATLGSISAAFGTSAELEEDGALVLRWRS